MSHYYGLMNLVDKCFPDKPTKNSTLRLITPRFFQDPTTDVNDIFQMYYSVGN